MLIAVIKTLVFVTRKILCGWTQKLFEKADIEQNIEEQNVSSLETQVVLKTPEIDEHISERIVKNYELRLMRTLPEINNQFKITTIITPEGAYQLNQEINEFKCLISAEEFSTTYKDFLFLLQHAAMVTDVNGILIYNTLTLKQLNMLDLTLKLRHGYTVIGYTSCEEVYLSGIDFILWGLCCRASDYPPLPEAYSRRLLALISRPIFFDVAASLRIAAQTNILFNYFEETYFEYNPNSKYDDSQFNTNNNQWFLLSLSGITILSMILLRSGFGNKDLIISIMTKVRLIEQSIIGFTFNLTNYGPLIISENAIKTCFFPAVLLGGLFGYFSKKNDVINIAQFSSTQFVLKSIFQALTVGSFCSFGLYAPIFDMGFLYVNYTPSVEERYLWDISIARYCVFSIMLFVSLPRYPYALSKLQYYGFHASNVMNGISMALLDNYALYLFIGLSFVIIHPQTFSPKQPVAPTIYCGLHALSMLSVLCVTFPTIANLQKYSIEKNPIEPSLPTKIYSFFGEAKKYFSRTDIDISRRKSFTSIEETSHPDGNAPKKFSILNYSITGLFSHRTLSMHTPAIKTIENPIQENSGHFARVTLGVNEQN